MYSFRSLPSLIRLFFRYIIFGHILVYIILGPILLLGQEPPYFKRLVAQGNIPNDFLISARGKFFQISTEIAQSTSPNITDEQQTFYEESSFYINQLLKSGKVLFNDPVSIYVKEVGYYLLRKHPELKKKVRFYVVKSTAVNAFATNSGIILINIGLLAKLENEAQLAFILAHEISHFSRQHPLEIFLQSKAIEKNNSSLFKPANLEEVLLAQNNYSKEKELEADLDGWKLYQQTAYDLNAALSVFNILKNTNSPIINKLLKIDFFENEYLKIPQIYIQSTIDSQLNHPLLAPKETTTHPAPKERQALIKEKIAQLTSSRIRHQYILGKDRFENIQEKCRLECGFLNLLNQKYEKAIYLSYLGTDISTDLSYLEKIKLHAFYALSKYSTTGKFWDIHQSYEVQIGPYKQIASFFERLKPVEINVLAITHHWKAYNQYPKDEEIFLQLQDLIIEFQKYYTKPYSLSPTNTIQDYSSLPEENQVAFIRNALSRLYQEKAFQVFFYQAIENIQADSALEKKNTKKSAKLSARQNIRRLRDPKGFHLGLERVIFVEPFYERIDSRSGQSEYLEQEAKEETFTELIHQYANQLNLSHQILSTDHLDKTQVDRFNDLSLLDEWITEKVQYGDIDMVSINHNEIQYLTQKYGSKHFVWTGSLALTRQRSGKILVASAGFLLPILLPYSIYYATTPSHHTWYYTVIFDLEKEEYILEYPRLIRMKDKSDIVNASVYDLIYQMKSRP